MNPFDPIRFFDDTDAEGNSLRPLLDRFHQGVTVVDARGVVRYMNAAQARIDDLASEAAIGQSVKRLYRVDEGASPTMTCLKTGKAVKNLACYYRTRLGRVVNSIHNVYPIRADGRILGAICIVTDYQNIEESFATVVKSASPGSLPGRGESDATRKTPHRTNGTRYTFDDIVGADPGLCGAVRSARLAAQSPSPILLYGETGTGKELFAQSIHNQSARRAKPYMAINCAAIPENLLEGMLFGTSRGAFTGAIDKAGLFEAAHGGTFFLDEVNAMSPGLQAKLLRFLQERNVCRVGSMKEISVDLKIISSTNVLPREAVDAGALRADLFFRLAVVLIEIPPLRARNGDLPRLVTHFLAKTNKTLGKAVTGIAAEVMDRFERYAWPGNVRELEHVIEGAMNMVGTETTVRMHHLPMSPQLGNPGNARAPAEPTPPPETEGTGKTVPAFPTEKIFSRKKTLAEAKVENEIAVITAALSKTRGNAAEAARRLGMSPQLMNYKLKRFKIDRREYKSTR